MVNPATSFNLAIYPLGRVIHRNRENSDAMQNRRDIIWSNSVRSF